MTGHQTGGDLLDAGSGNVGLWLRVLFDTGGDGPAVVLLHGVLMNGTLWDADVVDRLRGRYRCIVPELPFGAHRTSDAR